MKNGFTVTEFLVFQVAPGFLIAVSAYLANWGIDSWRESCGERFSATPRLSDYMPALWILPVGLGVVVLVVPILGQAEWWLVAMILVLYLGLWALMSWSAATMDAPGSPSRSITAGSLVLVSALVMFVTMYFESKGSP